MEMDEVLEEIYSCLQGKEFQAEYITDQSMATANERSVLEINDSDMKATLRKIRQQIKQSGIDEEKVWKAIRGPEDGYPSYRLWVDKLELPTEDTYTFRVISVKPFVPNKWVNPQYEIGMIISVKAVE